MDEKTRKSLSDFARFYGFHYDTLDTGALVSGVTADMERGLRGERSDMPMLPSYLRPVPALRAGSCVLALDAGGTNLRAARVRFDGGGAPRVEEIRKAAMPGTYGRLPAEKFFDEIADCCAPFFAGGADSRPESAGFCFSYPMEMREDGDAVTLAFSKEVDAPEVIGKPVGRGLRDALTRRGIKAPEKIILLNDAAAALLSAFGENQSESDGGRMPGNVIGFILGTGINTAYLETSIPKINYAAEEPEDPGQIVICESASFANGFWGRLDSEFDLTTKRPGFSRAEKISAGEYLGNLSLTILKRAVSEKLISFRKSAELLATEKLSTAALNAFLSDPAALQGELGSLFGKDETGAAASVLYLESIISERAGIMAAALIAGVMEHTQAGFDPLAPCRIAAEGTTYIRHYHLRRSLEAALHRMLTKNSPRYYTIAPVKQASLLGAAIATGCRTIRNSTGSRCGTALPHGFPCFPLPAVPA